MGRPLKIKKGSASGDAVIGATIGTAGSYTTAPTVSFALPTPGGVQATGTPTLGAVSATLAGTQSVAYASTDVLTVGASTFSVTLAAATNAVNITAATGTAGQVTVDSGTYVRGQSVLIVGTGGQGIVTGTTYYVLVGGTATTAIQLTNTYANAVNNVAGLTTTVGAIAGTTFNLGTTRNTITGVTVVTAGFNQTIPANPATPTNSGSGAGATLNVTYGVNGIVITNGGSGYTSVPAITFSAGAAAATALVSNAGGAVDKDIGYNPFNLLDPLTQVIPAGMTSSQYLGVVGGGYPGGVATAAYPTVAATAYVPQHGSEDNVYIITQKGATKYLVACQSTLAVTSLVVGNTYIVNAIGDTNWGAVGAGINAQEGDVFTCTAVGTGTGLVSDAGVVVLANVAGGSLASGQMQITVTTNSTAFRASKLTNKYVWNYATPRVKYAADFFIGAAAAVTTAGSGAEADTWANTTGNYTLGQVTDYTS